jgi:hypothetical protein
MTRNYRTIALLLTPLLTVGGARANVYTLGVVMQARKANLGNAVATAGTSVYDGDRLSTDANGSLILRSGDSTLYLSNATQVVLRGAGKEENAAQAEIGAGTVVFSIPPAATMLISAGGATIRPDTNAPTIGQITFIDEKSFQISARKGALKVSYYDDSEVVPEGNSYRVELYRSDDSHTATAIAGKPRRSNKRKRIALFLIAGGAVGAAVAAGVATGGPASSSSSGVAKDFESPDHP